MVKRIFVFMDAYRFYFLVGGILFFLFLLFLVIGRLRSRRFPYEARPLLTKREYHFYRMLRRETDRRGLLVFPKIGVKDLIQVNSQKHYMKYFRQIAQKHVDFVICDQSLHILFALELDDSSHDSPEAEKRDRFKDMAFRAARLSLKRIRDYDETSIRDLF